ncbi:tetraacyldisaccharide 4'-kinase [Orbaceae bacterium ESL0727]|nr:tetraacyldisaccharide 4'-kinase [Orbaceae bacterium ESL0727]
MHTMIEKLWYGKNRLYWLLIPFSLLYGAVVVLRRYLYQKHIFKTWRVPVPVVVIGNLSVGGNGKTPLVVTFVTALKERGLKVGIVSRGYGGHASHYPVIVDNHTSTAIAGDEPILIYQRTQVPLAVSPNRCEAVKALLANFELDLILTDDGLQHYQLERDVEVVVIDSHRQFGNGWWLPAGPLRERPNRLKTVDLIMMNGLTENHQINHIYPDKTYTMILKPLYVVNLLTGEQRQLTDLEQICAIAGISHPERFFMMLKKLHAKVIKTVAFADHQNFTEPLLNTVATDRQALLMTEKDAVKCRPFAKSNWWYLPIEAVVPLPAIDQLYALINQAVAKNKLSKG